MSTKTSIKYRRDQTDGAPGFHFYEDCFDVMHDGDAAPVFLRLDGVQIELETQAKGATVTIRMPREMAKALGLFVNTHSVVSTT